jgi:hypothetical protein
MATDSAMPTVTTPKEGDILTLERFDSEGKSEQFRRLVQEVKPLEDGRLQITTLSVDLTNMAGEHSKLEVIFLEADGVSCVEEYPISGGKSYDRFCRLVGVNLPQ